MLYEVITILIVRAPVATIASSSAPSPIPAQWTAPAAWAPRAVSAIPFSLVPPRCESAAVMTGVAKVSPKSRNSVEGTVDPMSRVSSTIESKYSRVIRLESPALFRSLSAICFLRPRLYHGRPVAPVRRFPDVFSRIGGSEWKGRGRRRHAGRSPPPEGDGSSSRAAGAGERKCGGAFSLSQEERDSKGYGRTLLVVISCVLPRCTPGRFTYRAFPTLFRRVRTF